jgi:hypothetical protein
VDPLEHGVVLAAELGSPGGGVMGAVGDQGEGQEAFAGAGVFGLEGQASQVIERLSPLLHLDADHSRPSSGGVDYPNLLSLPKVTRRSLIGNSRSPWDLGLDDLARELCGIELPQDLTLRSRIESLLGKPWEAIDDSLKGMALEIVRATLASFEVLYGRGLRVAEYAMVDTRMSLAYK